MKRSQFNAQLKSLVREAIEEKFTNSKKNWADMMVELSNHVDHPVVLDDMGNYNVCDCEPHHISIRPIVHDTFDVKATKDGTDRTKVLNISFKDLKIFIKDFIESADPNYVDSALSKVAGNSLDKEAGKKGAPNADDITETGSSSVEKKVKIMFNGEDTEHPEMEEVGEIKRMVDYPETKQSYTYPKLPKELHKLVIKYGKKARGRPRKK
jgi:hypothetical protein